MRRGATALAAVFVAWQGERIVHWAKSLWAAREPTAQIDTDDWYHRVAIPGPITSGGPPQALAAPTEGEILAALAGTPEARRFAERAKRNRGRMTLERVAEHVASLVRHQLLSVAAVAVPLAL